MQDLDPHGRRRIRQLKARPVTDARSKWLTLQRHKVPDGSATAKGIDYSLNRWAALTRYLGDGRACRPTTTGCSPGVRVPRPGIAATSLVADHHRHLIAPAVIKTGSPDAYPTPT